MEAKCDEEGCGWTHFSTIKRPVRHNPTLKAVNHHVNTLGHEVTVATIHRYRKAD